MKENKPIKFVIRDPIFREKRVPQVEVKETTFSEESNNLFNRNGEMGWKQFSMLNKEDNDLIGKIYYDYPNKESQDQILRIRIVGLEEKYKGQNLAIKLYKELIERAKAQKLEGIGSDASVAGGALTVWKKLMDEGYNLRVDPSMEEKWKLFLKIYNEGKIFKEKLESDTKASVFKILFKEQKE